MNARMLTEALADPTTTAKLDAHGWNALIAMARAERLAGSLAVRLSGLDLPPAVAATLADALGEAEAGRRAALWEADRAVAAIDGLGLPLILLKGTAFVAAGLSAGRGRLIGDTDILIPRDRLDEVEARLLDAGWEWVKPDPYDDAYYRRWMHELPPLIHVERDRMIDVHHTILPLTARPRPDAAALIAEAVPLSNGLAMLSPPDMLVHAAAHLIADGDLSGGLRNLWDIHLLAGEFSELDPEFWHRLGDRARLHRLERATARALRLSASLYGTSIPATWRNGDWADSWFEHCLTARDGWGRQTRKLVRGAFYIRSHWLRMPPAMLARHLWTKWRMGKGG